MRDKSKIILNAYIYIYIYIEEYIKAASFIKDIYIYIYIYISDYVTSCSYGTVGEHTHIYTHTHTCIYMCTFLFIYIYHHHHHHVVSLARISLILSCHFSLSFIASGRSSGQHPVSSHSCWMYVRASRPAFAQPYVGSICVHHLRERERERERERMRKRLVSFFV